MIILILINVLIIIYTYFEYYKPKEKIKNEKQEIKDIDAVIVGYINDQGVGNNFDLIIAEIIELNIKGYITIEYEKTGLGRYNYIIKQNISMSSDKLNNYEVVVLNFLFPKKMELKKSELEEKFRDTVKIYNIQFKEMEKALNKELIKQGIINGEKQNIITKKIRQNIKRSSVFIILLMILYWLNIFNGALYLLIYILEKVIIIILLVKANFYTSKGQLLRYNINNYTSINKYQEFLNEQAKIEDIVRSKEFANSIALHINTVAKSTFINYDIMKKTAMTTKKTLAITLNFFIVIFLLGVIIAKMTSGMSLMAMIVMYTLIAIIGALIADITYAIAQKK